MKLTINLDERVCKALQAAGGKRDLKEYVEDVVRAHAAELDLDAGYKDMAADEQREVEARAWAEAMIGDVAHETR
jgi:hypothetical protein